MTVGHINNPVTENRFQVVDSPGLLDRPPEERNEMEKLTFASMAHLPTVRNINCFSNYDFLIISIKVLKTYEVQLK